jgi:hypothetical protein
MTTLFQLQELNNKAVAMIRDGFYGDAIPMLSQTLKLAKSQIRTLAAETYKRRAGCSMVMGAFVRIRALSFHEQHGFSTPIEIDVSFGEECPECYTQTVFYALFNVALAHHLEALQCQDFQQRNSVLVTALQLYELASHTSLSNYEENDTTIVAKIAILNNLLMIHCELHHEKQAVLCRQKLLESIMFLSAFRDTTKLSLLGEAMCNVLSIVLRDACVAPAA